MKIIKANHMIRRLWKEMRWTQRVLMSGFFVLVQAVIANGATFQATGPTSSSTQPGVDQVGVVTVSFSQVPTTLSFDVPWNYCRVTENGIKCMDSAPETYDPVTGAGDGFLSSFEVGMDDNAQYIRIWIEQQSAARILVRVRYALCNMNYAIAHSTIASGSPYGSGDWGDEWWYIYPDGTYTRHMKIYSGLAFMSWPFGFFREPPQIDHEFEEAVVIMQNGHTPDTDINSTSTLMLYKMFGNKTESVYPSGLGSTFSYSASLKDFGEFRDANIYVINTKSTYKPFSIAMPDGQRADPYTVSGDTVWPWIETWGPYDFGNISYESAVMHQINWWHYSREDKTAEQVYLQGMTSDANPMTNLVQMGWSWIIPPELQMSGVQAGYLTPTYDAGQRAYVIPNAAGGGPFSIDLNLVGTHTNAYLSGTMWLVNPTFVVSNWNATGVGTVQVNGQTLTNGTDFFAGYEPNGVGTNMILWVNKKYDVNNASGHAIPVSISPAPTNVAPVAPTANAATAVSSNGFTANWSASYLATGYYLDVSTNSGFSSFVSGYNNLNVGNVTSRAVSGLSASTTYYYRVRAYNAYGTSGNSGTISVTTSSGGGGSPPPTYQAAGAAASGTGAVTPAWPAHQAGDVALLIVETANEAISLSTPAGFTEVSGSPQGTGTAGGTTATRMAVFWKRATSSSDPNPTVADSGNHQIAQILTFRGVTGSGNPWNVTAGDVASSASTSVSIPGATTTVANALVVAIVANGTDTTTAQTSSWANGNLTNVKATAGVIGTTTATLATSSVQGRMCIALAPGPAAPPLLWLPFENSLADLGSGLTHTISSNKFPSGTGTVVFTNNVANTSCGSASLYFPGDGSFIKVGNASDLKFNSTNAFTVSAWVKTTNTAGVIWAYTATNVIVGGGTHTIACWVSGGGQGSPGTVALDVYYVGAADSGSTTVNDGNWHNVVVTYAATNWYIYIDGVQRASKNMAAANEGAHSDAGKWYTCIGATSNTNWPNEGVNYEPYKGLCDEVTYWGSALSASQVSSLYTNVNHYSFVVPIGPTLNIATSGGNVTLSWSENGWKLQQNSDLTDPAGWSDVSGGTNSPVNVTIGAGSQFFRLVRQ